MSNAIDPEEEGANTFRELIEQAADVIYLLSSKRDGTVFKLCQYDHERQQAIIPRYTEPHGLYRINYSQLATKTEFVKRSGVQLRLTGFTVDSQR